MRLNLHRFGPPAGPPVLALHGVRNHGGRFRRLAADALAARRVLAPDLRGHGGSGWDPPWDAATHLADILETLDAEGVTGPVDVVGHSFGGFLALRLAAVAPDRVGDMVLVDPAVALPPGLCADEAHLDVTGQARAARFATIEEARRTWLSLRPPAGHWALEEDLAAFLAPAEGGGLRFRFAPEAAVCAWSEMAHPPVAVDGWPGRAVLVTALRQPFVTGALRAMLRASLGTRLTETGIDAGHMLIWDAPGDLAAVVRRALG